jgi:hypothetical protein
MSGMDNSSDADIELKEFKEKFKKKFPHLYKSIKKDTIFIELMNSKYYDEVMG